MQHASPAVRRTRARGLEIAAVFAASLGYFLLFLHFGYQPEDEGTLLFQFDRVVRGDIPYVDFHTGYTPGFFYGGAALLEWFGRSTTSVRVALAVMNALSAAGLYAFGRKIAGPALALVAPLLWIAFLPAPTGDFASFNIPYPTWPATLAWVAVALCLLSWSERGGLARVACTSLAAAAAFAVRPDAGAFTMAAAVWVLVAFSRISGAADRVAGIAAALFMGVGVWFAFDFRLWGSDALVHLVPTAVIVALSCGPLAARFARDEHPRALAALTVLAVPFLLVSVAWMIPLYRLLGHDLFLREVLLVGAGYADLYYVGHEPPQAYAVVVVVATLVFAGVGQAVRRGFGAPHVFLAGGVAAALVGVASLATVGLMPEGFLASIRLEIENAAFWFAVVANFTGVSVLARAARAGRRGAFERGLAVAVPLAVAMYLQLFPRSDFMHQITGVPLTAVLGAALLARVSRWWELGRWPAWLPARPTVRATLLASAFAVACSALIPAARGPLLVISGQHEPLDMPASAPVRVPLGTGDELVAQAKVAAFLSARTEPGEPLLAFPASAGLLFLADRTHAVSHDYWFPGRPDHAEEQRMLSLLGDRRPRYIVTLNSTWIFFQHSAAYFADLREWAVRDYRLVARYGRHDILARRDLPDLPALGEVEVWRPEGPLEDLAEPWLPRRRQAARRWVAGLTPESAEAARLPEDPRRAVLTMRAVRDIGDLRATALAVRGLESASSRVHKEARVALGAAADCLVPAPHRWADDIDEAAYYDYVARFAERVPDWRLDGDDRVRRFGNAVDLVLQAARDKRRADGQAP